MYNLLHFLLLLYLNTSSLLWQDRVIMTVVLRHHYLGMISVGTYLIVQLFLPLLSSPHLHPIHV